MSTSAVVLGGFPPIASPVRFISVVPTVPIGLNYGALSYSGAEAACQAIAKMMIGAGWSDEGYGPAPQYMDGFNEPATILPAANLPPGSPYQYHTPGRLMRNIHGAGTLVWLRGTTTSWGLGGGGVWEAIPTPPGTATVFGLAGGQYSPRFRVFGASNSYFDTDVLLYPADPGAADDPGPYVIIGGNSYSIEVCTFTGAGRPMWMGSPATNEGGLAGLRIDPCFVWFSSWAVGPWQGTSGTMRAGFRDFDATTGLGGTANLVSSAYTGAETCGFVIPRYDGLDKYEIRTADGSSIATAPGIQVHSDLQGITGERLFGLDLIALTEKPVFGVVRNYFGLDCRCLCGSDGADGMAFSIWAATGG